MANIQTTICPHTQEPLLTRQYPAASDLDIAIQKSSAAQTKWAKVPLEERIAIGRKFADAFRETGKDDTIPKSLSLEMGRPISQGPGEIRGFLERADYLLSIASTSLSDVALTDTDKPGFKRFIKRVPHGVVFVIAPWNFPYLVSINSFLPAILAGNSVLIKPSPQTPTTAEVIAACFKTAGLPEDVIQVLHLPLELTTHVIQHPLVNFVSFTGSVVGGQAVEKAAVESKVVGFKGVALELGGKDPAYVRADADLQYTVAELVDGAFFNSGQSCCAVERIYVHESIYEDFVSQFVDVVKQYKLGPPLEKGTNLGPVVSLASAERIRKQIADAVATGAKALVPEDLFPVAKVGTTYVAPQVLVDVNHEMDIMMVRLHLLLGTFKFIEFWQEETFGPVVGIQRVSSDDEAVRFMNDSPYGLTASIWTNASANPDSEEAFLKIADAIETGTLFLNRCDYLDPALAWTGVKNSGRGVSLSKFGFDQLTRPKSIHMKIKTT
ncbi:ALDH-like protein [Pleurotus eryngii]|uniref:ALDH-like protein n=1 Tax=Pleurotus eryngii TaxID=5323 RepID=A0A9P5ZU76_PLEER|nr:ALDH-like protein [Pleurotus eryngii]